MTGVFLGRGFLASGILLILNASLVDGMLRAAITSEMITHGIVLDDFIAGSSIARGQGVISESPLALLYPTKADLREIT